MPGLKYPRPYEGWEAREKTTTGPWCLWHPSSGPNGSHNFHNGVEAVEYRRVKAPFVPGLFRNHYPESETETVFWFNREPTPNEDSEWIRITP